MYAKHGNLVDAVASGAKASTKHLESRLEVIQGHKFWDHWKADDRGSAYYCGLKSGISKENLSIPIFENLTAIRRPLARIFAQTLYF